MSLTYASDRAVFFHPRRIKSGMCLKCVTPTERISPRTIAARASAGYGMARVRELRGVLTLCERCDARWSRATGIESIDEDGTIGLRNVHPETRDKIVELGEADYLP